MRTSDAAEGKHLAPGVKIAGHGAQGLRRAKKLGMANPAEESTRAASAVPVSERIAGFKYAIRNIVSEATKIEQTGRTVRYLNIGDPVQFGFQTPPHLLNAVDAAIRAGQNGYGPSAGIASAREAVAADLSAKGLPTSADRVVLTSGASEGIELALNALANPGDEVLVPVPTYPLYTAVLAKIGARAVYYPLNPDDGWQPDLDRLASLSTPRTRAIVIIHPNNPTGAVYSPEIQRRLIQFSERRGLAILADEVYAELAFEGAVPPLGSREPEAPILTFGSLSKGYLAPGWRAGWVAVGKTRRLDDVLAGIRKLADGRLCSPVPMQFAITAALTGDRSHQAAFVAALRERAELTNTALNAIPGIRSVPARAAFYVMPRVSLPRGKTDEDYVLGLLRTRGILCVPGSGFGMSPDAGCFRIVFLATPRELSAIYSDISSFTREFLA
jgi:alanine-synthesizing transaminase